MVCRGVRGAPLHSRIGSTMHIIFQGTCTLAYIHITMHTHTLPSRRIHNVALWRICGSLAVVNFHPPECRSACIYSTSRCMCPLCDKIIRGEKMSNGGSLQVKPQVYRIHLRRIRATMHGRAPEPGAYRTVGSRTGTII